MCGATEKRRRQKGRLQLNSIHHMYIRSLGVPRIQLTRLFLRMEPAVGWIRVRVGSAHCVAGAFGLKIQAIALWREEYERGLAYELLTSMGKWGESLTQVRSQARPGISVPIICSLPAPLSQTLNARSHSFLSYLRASIQVALW